MINPAALMNRGVQPGSVNGATKISPACSTSRWGSRTTRTTPSTTPAEATRLQSGQRVRLDGKRGIIELL